MGMQGLSCNDEERRRLVAEDPALQGIDYIEVSPDQLVLKVYFIEKTTAAGQTAQQALLNRLHDHPEKVTVEGGVRVKHIKVLLAKKKPGGGGLPDYLEVTVNERGDFSDYTLAIADNALDAAYARVLFSFKVDCPSRFDCKPSSICPPDVPPEIVVDYMAKDYASFRQALLDLIPRLAPDWKERHDADLGMVLVQLLAYTADHLSYYQDAVANEAYLETARQRISVRRHARLIDYRMHDGASARTFVHFRANSPGVVPAHTQVLTRLALPIGSRQPPHPAVLDTTLATPALAIADAVFETLSNLTVAPILNEIRIHDWGDRQCCLPRGTTDLYLAGDLAALLQSGDYLLFEEVLGPDTGLAADADPQHRQVVRLSKVENAGSDLLVDDPVTHAPQALTHVAWARGDALAFPLCLSIKQADGQYVPGVSVARGNLVLADHGRTVSEWYPGDPADPSVPGIHVGPRAFRFPLRLRPISSRLPLPPDQPFPATAADLRTADPRQAMPEVKLQLLTATGTLDAPGPPVPDLLGSGPFDLDFVVEIENDGGGVVRLGDDVYGQAAPDGAHIQATYRVGAGLGGNVGHDTLQHVIRPAVAPSFPALDGVRNPLAAWGGADLEALQQVKQLAPPAMRAVQERAVTEADYAAAAELHPDVERAVATFRWTGSWYTVFVSIDPAGRADLPPELRAAVRSWVARYTQAGYDLEIRGPIYAPLDLALEICVAPGYFRGDVEKAVLQALGSQALPDGRRGLFHPDNWTFGQPVYLSKLYAAVAAVPGVQSALVTRLQRFAKAAAGELAHGYMPIGRLEIARLDNDPNFPENGVLELKMQGSL